MDQALTCLKRDVRVTWIPDPLNRALDRSFPFPWLGPSRVRAYAEWLEVPADPTIVARLNGRELARAEWDWTFVGPGDDLRFVRMHAGIGTLIILGLGKLLYGAAGLTASGVAAAGVIDTIVIGGVISTGLSLLAQAFQERPQTPDRPEERTYNPHGLITNQNPHGSPIAIPAGEVVVPGVVIEKTTGHLGGQAVRFGQFNGVFGGQRSLTLVALGEGPVDSICGVSADVDGLAFGETGPDKVEYDWTAHTSDPPIAMKTTAAGAGAIHQIYFLIALKPKNETHHVTEIRIRLRRVDHIYPTPPTGSMKVWIERAPGRTPDGIPLHEKIEVPLTAINTSSFEDQLFRLPVPIPIVPGSTHIHAVKVEADYPVSTESYVEVGCTADKQGVGNTRAWNGSAWWAPHTTSGGWSYPVVTLARVASHPRRFQGTGLHVAGSDVKDFGGQGTLCFRLGNRDQKAMPHLHATKVESPVDATLHQDNEVVETTTDVVDGFGVVIGFPQGYYHQDRGGKIDSAQFKLRVRWRPNGETNWTGQEIITHRHEARSPQVATFRAVFEEGGPGAQLRGQKIDVGVTKLAAAGHAGPKAIDWVALQELGDVDAQSHPNLAMVLFDVDAEMTAGPMDNLAFAVRGRTIRYAASLDGNDNPIWTYGFSENPADWIIHLILDTEYGGGRHHKMSVDNIDWPAAIEARDYCDEQVFDKATGLWLNRWVISLNIDTKRTWWEWCQVIAAAARIKIIPVGNKVKLKPDQPRPMMKVFSVGSYVAGSYHLHQEDPSARTNRVIVKYWDRENRDWDHAIADDLDARVEAEDVIEEEIEILGVPDKHRAGRHAKCLLNRARLLTCTHEFEAFLEYADVEKGQVVGFQTNVPEWEQIGGRAIEAGVGGNAVKIDQDLVLDDSSDPYYLTYWTTDDGTGEEVCITREILKGAGPFPKTIAKGQWVNVTETFPTNQYPKGPSADGRGGDPYAIQPVRNPEAPQLGVKLIDITDIHLTQEKRVRIKAEDYNALVYDDEPDAYDRALAPSPAVTRWTIPDAPRHLVLSPYVDDDGHYIVKATYVAAPWEWQYRIAVFVRPHIGGHEAWARYTTVESSAPEVLIRGAAPRMTYSVALCPIAPASVDRRYHPSSDRVARETVRVRPVLDQPGEVLNLREVP